MSKPCAAISFRRSVRGRFFFSRIFAAQISGSADRGRTSTKPSVRMHSGGTLSEIMQGKPAACASTIVTGSPSYSDGNTNTSIACIRSATSLRTPRKRTCSAIPSVCALACIFGISSPPPTSKRIAFGSFSAARQRYQGGTGGF